MLPPLITNRSAEIPSGRPLAANITLGALFCSFFAWPAQGLAKEPGLPPIQAAPQATEKTASATTAAGTTAKPPIRSSAGITPRTPSGATTLPAPDPDKLMVSLTLRDCPLEASLLQVAQKCNLELTLSPAARQALNGRVSATFDHASLRDALTWLLGDTGLKFNLSGNCLAL